MAVRIGIEQLVVLVRGSRFDRQTTAALRSRGGLVDLLLPLHGHPTADAVVSEDGLVLGEVAEQDAEAGALAGADGVQVLSTGTSPTWSYTAKI